MSQPLFLILSVAVIVFAGCVVLIVSERLTCHRKDDGTTCWPLFAHLGEDFGDDDADVRSLADPGRRTQT